MRLCNQGINKPSKYIEDGEWYNRVLNILEWCSEQDFFRNPAVLDHTGYGSRAYEEDWCVSRTPKASDGKTTR